MEIKHIMAVALVMVAGWYFFDGRYDHSTSSGGQFRHRVDRITGERCQMSDGHGYWYACK